MVIIAFRLAQPNVDYLSIAALIGIALVNGIASSSLAVLLQYILAQILGMTTALQLMEISRPDHPLLQFILRNAPGTYQHSLQVANLAEQAAENIGADTLLTRVGAIYHDAGKAINPYFFIENQLPGNTNPHDNLSPISSSHTIISHVPDGIELARKYRLPRRIQDFIGEHHGTMITRYQYAKAVDAAGGDEGLVDKSQFGYPGPRPRSRETAILMLADGSEARVRAERPPDENALRKVIKSVIEQRLSSGQLDETDLTLRDLDQLIDSFTTTLRGIYHPRLEYPDEKKEMPIRAEEVPTVPIIARKSSNIPANPPADS
jgi:putative nucleotidyltransferase with HDIG domain